MEHLLVPVSELTLEHCRQVRKAVKATFGCYPLIEGNTKLGKAILTFNLEAVKTCKPTKWCLKNCYAMKGNFMFPTVKTANERRYNMTQHPMFHFFLYCDLLYHVLTNRRKGDNSTTYIRLHSSGDLYAAHYTAAWEWVAVQARIQRLNCRFLAFTKQYRYGLTAGENGKRIEMLANQPNVSVILSCDDSYSKPIQNPDNGPFGLAYVEDDKELPKQVSTFTHCPGSCITCKHCWDKQAKVVFHKH